VERFADPAPIGDAIPTVGRATVERLSFEPAGQNASLKGILPLSPMGAGSAWLARLGGNAKRFVGRT